MSLVRDRIAGLAQDNADIIKERLIRLRETCGAPLIAWNLPVRKSVHIYQVYP
jgi:hypothetical protein